MRRLTAAVLVVVASLAVTPAAGADLGSDLARVADQIDQLKSEIEQVEGARTEYANAVLETAAALDVVASELRTAQAALDVTETEIAVTEATLADLLHTIERREALVARLQADAAGERAAALARAVEVYMSAHADLSITFIDGDAPEAGVGLIYADRVQNVADRVIAEYELHRLQEQQEVERLVTERAVAAEHRVALAAQESERRAQAAEVAVRVAAVANELTTRQALLDEIDSQIHEFEGEIASLEREQGQIEALIEQEQSRGGTAPGVLLRPVPGGVSSGYGWRIHPIYGNQRLHTGWDMNASCGEPIRAAASGRVIFSGWRGGYGNAVMIDHGGGISTLYGHQSKLGVAYGQQVAAGQVIGWIGTTGTSTACHLHWEVRVNGSPVDPSGYA